MIRSFRFSAKNVALFYVTASLIILSVFATPLWYVWRNTIEAARTELLQADAQKLTNIFVTKGSDSLATAIEERVGKHPDGSRRIIMLADPTLKIRAGNLAAWPREVVESGKIQSILIDADGRQIHVLLLGRALPGGYHLLTGLDVDRYEKLETIFLYGLLGSGASVLVIAILGGLLIRRALLSRVDVISQTTTAIVEGDLSRRLPALYSGVELEMLTGTINSMLNQIEHLVHGIRNVSNAIAHDLRTPLAELRSRLEELSMIRPSSDKTFAEIDGAIADVDRVIAIFNALLRLAEIDSGTRRSGFVEVDVTRVASEIAEFYQPVAELKGIALTFVPSDELHAPGDPLLLAQAVSNLIDNALKYAQQDGAVSVTARRRSDQAVEIVVSDDGSGIPDDEKPKVIERFYRSDTSRCTPGVGLGLSLVAAVARLHGGSLELRDNHPGLQAVLLLGA